VSVEPKTRGEPTQRIVEVVAEREGVDAVDLDPPLFEVLDGDLLNSLLESNANSGQGASLELSFEYQGYDVHVSAGGSVRVSND
jgi:hypothetical protein